MPVSDQKSELLIFFGWAPQVMGDVLWY